MRWVGPKTGAPRSRLSRKELITSSSGTFEFRGTEKPLGLELYASKEGLLDSEIVSATPGEARVELVLTSCGAVRGSVIVDDASLLDDIELHIDANYRDGDMRRSPPLRPSAVGGFSFLDVCPDNVRLSVVAQGVNLIDIAGIRVERKGSPPDPRLRPLDLRDRLQRLTIELQGADDQSPVDGTVSLRDPTSSVPTRMRRTEDGTIRFVVPKGSYLVDVRAPGWRRERLSQVDGDRVVRLKRSLPVRFVLDGVLDLPPLPHRLAIGLSAGAGAQASVDDALGSFGDGGEVRLVLTSTGSHVLSWYLESGNRSRFLCNCGGQTIEVGDSKDEQTIHLVLEPDVVRSWKAMLRLHPSVK